MAQMETVVVVDQSESQPPKEPHLTYYSLSGYAKGQPENQDFLAWNRIDL